MKIGNVAILAGAGLALAYLLPRILEGVGTQEEVRTVYLDKYVPQYSLGDTTLPVYSPEVYHTEIPVIPSEPGVSEGIPTTGAIPLCPQLTPAVRFTGDTQLLCQCPRGQIQGGNADTMRKLMLGEAPEDIAWREGFCF